MVRFLGIITIVVWLIKAFYSLVILDHVDALNYHMVVPKYLANGLWHEAWTTVPGALMSGVFEFLYLVPHLFFGYGVISHASCQFIHFFFSLGLGSVVLYQSLKEKSKLLAILAALSILTLSKGAIFFFFAKNDGPLALSYLCCLLLYLKLSESDWGNKKQIYLFGLLLGLIPSIKLNGLLYILPIVCHFLFYQWRNFRLVSIVSVISLTVFFPILIRNYYYIGAPFFPGLLNHFPGQATKEMVEYYTGAISAPLTLSKFFENLKLIFMGKIIFLSVPVLFVLNLVKGQKRLNLSLLFVFASFTLYLITNGGVISYRFHFPSYFALVFFIFNSLYFYTNGLEKIRPGAVVIFLVLILVDSKIDKSIKNIKRGVSLYSNYEGRSLIRKVIGPSRFWDHVTNDERKVSYILSDNLSQQYYAPTYIRIIQVQHHKDASFLFNCKNDDLFKLKKFSFALVMKENIPRNPCYELIAKKKLVDSYHIYNLYDLGHD